LFQAKRLKDVAAASNGALRVITNQRELKAYIAARQTATQPITAGFLGIEGLQALDDELANVKVFYDAGIRMMALTHFYDNALGGSSAGLQKIGITPFGTQVLNELNARNIIVDVAHASKPLIDDILRLSTKPVVTSHSGVAAVCPVRVCGAYAHMYEANCNAVVTSRDGVCDVFRAPEIWRTNIFKSALCFVCRRSACV
jgi:membrane dipeptidase